MEDERDAYWPALRTMKLVVESLRDEPDPDGVLEDLIERIEGERAWVFAEMVLGQPPRRPPAWVKRAPALTA